MEYKCENLAGYVAPGNYPDVTIKINVLEAMYLSGVLSELSVDDKNDDTMKSLYEYLQERVDDAIDNEWAK